ncbi:PilX N-terminal domain-containing pilus assembly protein [Pseudomonas sp. C11]|jgi:type IV pilus assembly protein PilX|uniref:PilX N-terminal domain-containing pilus assembly protein n=1 Tax=Pseudomonas sp. C11 TaxID=3075550 RepID=UPI002AFE48B1|nr:PilX N-terminal domain-containing pilus assembly protein [Pseudomonas sp. C11]
MNPSKQKGMVLLVSLILLLMLTLIAITASNQATLQLRISSNSEQRTMAFQAAEGGIANWVSSYFIEADNSKLPKSGTIGETSFSIVESKSRWDIACPGGNLGIGTGTPRMDCFDLTVEGGSVCENGVCAVKAIHRQGGQRRGDIQ